MVFLRAAAAGDPVRTSDHGRFPAHFRIVLPFVALQSEFLLRRCIYKRHNEEICDGPGA
jgi:hypothetical protein